MENGYYTTVICIKKDAIPIDNITKYAWDDDDYEEIKEFVKYTEDELNEIKTRENSETDSVINDQDDAICALYEENLALKKTIADIDDAICYLYEQINIKNSNWGVDEDGK